MKRVEHWCYVVSFPSSCKDSCRGVLKFSFSFDVSVLPMPHNREFQLSSLVVMNAWTMDSREVYSRYFLDSCFVIGSRNSCRWR